MSAPYGQDPMDVNYEGTSTDDPSGYNTGSEPAAVPSIPNASLQATGQPMVPSVDTIQLSTYPYVSPWPASDSGSGGVAVSDTVQTAQEYHRQRWEMFTASRALFEIRLRLTDQFKKAASLPQTSRPAYTQTLTGLLNQYHQQYELYVSATASVLPIAQRMLSRSQTSRLSRWHRNTTTQAAPPPQRSTVSCLASSSHSWGLPHPIRSRS